MGARSTRTEAMSKERKGISRSRRYQGRWAFNLRQLCSYGDTPHEAVRRWVTLTLFGYSQHQGG
jgi:hypothetical protein